MLFYVGPSALVANDSLDKLRVVKEVHRDGRMFKVVFYDGGIEYFRVDKETKNDRTGTLVFKSYDKIYKIRPVREEDAFVLSKYDTLLPETSIAGLAENWNGEFVAQENLVAYMVDDSAYVAALVYTNSTGSWLRSNREWVMLGDMSATEGMEVMSIDPEKADEFIEMFDNNYVSVDDASKYEEGGASEED